MTSLINISEIAATWPVKDGWKIAPAGLAWIAEGSRIQLGVNCLLDTGCRLGDSCRLGDECVLGKGAADPIDLGFTDGYRKVIAQVQGVAYIGAGCRWFTLEEAQEHWQHRGDRALTRCALEAAKAIATAKGWKTQ